MTSRRTKESAKDLFNRKFLWNDFKSKFLNSQLNGVGTRHLFNIKYLRAELSSGVIKEFSGAIYL